MLYGFKIRVSEAAVEIPWILPKERFFEWEEKDVPFCRKFGIGKAGPAQPCAYRIGDTLILHPAIYKHLQGKMTATPETDPWLPIIDPPGIIKTLAGL
jgi:hypothetical protein